MIRPSPLLEEFERRYAREAYRGLDYEAALALFTGLWIEAAALDDAFPRAWRDDLQADLAVARAVNGLPPGP